MKEKTKKLLDNKIAVYPRGSVVYGTYEEGVSDIDRLVVVDNKCEDLLKDDVKGVYQDTDDEIDYQFMCEKTFEKMIYDNCIEVLECIFSKPTEHNWKYMDMFVLDKWKLRQSVSSICSNSWVKCKKKLTVEKDYDLRCGQKSLWHSLRIYMYGIQLAETGKIYDWAQANRLWYEIRDAETPTWEYYYQKYKKLHNELRSKLVLLCNKPIS